MKRALPALGLLVALASAPARAALAPAPEPPPLSPAVAQRLQRAADLRGAGLLDRSRDSLQVLLREHPHHPRLVAELGRTLLAREEWRELERVAVAERLAWRDSTLLAPELSQALERLGRPREALRVAIEAWSVSPGESGWAAAAVVRLAPLDARGTTMALEGAVSARPWRTDLALGLARLHTAAGRPEDAVRVLAEAERRGARIGLRQTFADESLRLATPTDTAVALHLFADLAGDGTRPAPDRVSAARRLWIAANAGGREVEWAPRLARALRDFPPARWGPDLLLGVVRALHRGGEAEMARALLAADPSLARRLPELSLEKALAMARAGDLVGALALTDSLVPMLPSAQFTRAELLFFSGALDSAQAQYTRVAGRPTDDRAADALERLYLLEEAPDSPLRTRLGRLAWLRWRGSRAEATALADTLWRAQSPRGEYAAHCALELAELRREGGDLRGALVPLMVVCDSLADDRLAPLARQRAGDAWLALGDSHRAVEQYEECLVRYPRAWNSAEVRRRLDRLRREAIR
jgi:tetratricopeptide (TPR) repeat protein